MVRGRLASSPPALRTVTTTPAASEMGRLAQLLKAAGLTAPVPVAQPSGPQQGSAAEAEELASLGKLPTLPPDWLVAPLRATAVRAPDRRLGMPTVEIGIYELERADYSLGAHRCHRPGS